MPRHRRMLRLGLALAMGGVFVGVALYTREALGVDWSVASLRELVERMGLWGPVGFVFLVGFRTFLMLPSQLVLTAAGICFGLAAGTLVGTLGLLVSGGWAFGLCRWLGADALRGRVPERVHSALEVAGSRGGSALVAVGTGYPFGPTTAYHAAAGLTPMSALRFFAALGLGAMVRSATFAYFGDSLAERSWEHVLISLGVVVLALLPLAHPGVRGWARAQFGLGPAPRASGRGEPRIPQGDSQGGARIGR